MLIFKCIIVAEKTEEELQKEEKSTSGNTRNRFAQPFLIWSSFTSIVHQTVFVYIIETRKSKAG